MRPPGDQTTTVLPEETIPFIAETAVVLGTDSGLSRKEPDHTDLRIALILALFSLALVVSLLWSGVHVVAEDGYYYYKIAQQMASGAGSTFDGLHPTNGYHPLWLFCLTPIFLLTHNPHTALTLGTLLQGMFLAAGSVMVYLTARLRIGRASASLSALLWLLLSYRDAVSGLEYSLHALGMLTTAYLYLRWLADGRMLRHGPYLGLSLAASLTFLARLDTLLLAGILGLTLCWQEWRARWRRDSLSRLFAFGLPVLVTCLIYAGINQWLFGHPVPVSSVVKRDWSLTLLRQDPIYQVHGWPAAKGALLTWPLRSFRTQWPLVLGSFGTAGFCLGTTLRKQGSAAWERLRRSLQSLIPFAAFSVLQILVTVGLYHSDLCFKPWYYVAQPWLAALLIGLLFQGVTETTDRRLPGEKTASTRLLLSAVLVASWLLVPVKTLLSVRQWEYQQRHGLLREPLYDAALWTRAHLPPDAVLGSWNAGAIGYLSGHRVVNLDGLVNSWDYYQTERHNLCRYWQRAGVTYLVDAFENGQALSRVPTHASYAPCASRLQRVWSADRYHASWRMEAYRVGPPDR